MGTHGFAEPRSVASRAEALLIWLGGGHWRQPGERREQSTHAVAGAVVLLGSALAGVVAGLAVSESTAWSWLAIVPLVSVFALLVDAAVRGTASGPGRGRAGIAGRVAAAVATGVVVGELAALVAFCSSIDRLLDERVLRSIDAAPAVAQASASLQQAKGARAALDNAVAQARAHQEQALVIARCEYNPTPACPQTRITGVPGPGPETRTANDLLADARGQLDNAVAARDQRAPELDATVSRQELALMGARQSVIADARRGLGARWVAMNELTLADAGTFTLRLLLNGLFALVYLLPLALGLWRGETTHDRRASARADRERAELDADTAIAIKRAEVRREAEIMWAEHRLTRARLTIEAQTEIDREQQRRRVIESLEGSARASTRRAFEPEDGEIYLPIAAEAEAASRALTPLPLSAEPVGAEEVAAATSSHPQNLPAQLEPAGEAEPRHERGAPSIPSIPGATKAAARWIRPLVPPFVARVIDNTTQPLRSARQVFEEVEEITFSLRRTRKVTVHAESSDIQPPHQSGAAETPTHPGKIASSREERPRCPSAFAVSPTDSLERDGGTELTGREGPRELRSPDGPRQLPPVK